MAKLAFSAISISVGQYNLIIILFGSPKVGYNIISLNLEAWSWNKGAIDTCTCVNQVVVAGFWAYYFNPKDKQCQHVFKEDCNMIFSVMTWIISTDYSQAYLKWSVRGSSKSRHLRQVVVA